MQVIVIIIIILFVKVQTIVEAEWTVVAGQQGSTLYTVLTVALKMSKKVSKLKKNV